MDPQPVAVLGGLDGLAAERLAKARDAALHHLGPGRRRCLAPDRLGERVRRGPPTPGWTANASSTTRSRRPESRGSSLDLERSQNRDTHVPNVDPSSPARQAARYPRDTAAAPQWHRLVSQRDGAQPVPGRTRQHEGPIMSKSQHHLSHTTTGIAGPSLRAQRRRSVAVITVAVGALLGALGVSSASAAPPAGTDASEVTHWNQVAATTLAAVPGPNGGAPPAFAINMGMVQGAVYDAVNAIGPKQHRAISARQAHRCEGVHRRRCRNGCLRRALRARLDGTGEGAIPRSRGTPEHALLRVRSLARLRSTTTRSRSRASRWDTQRPRPCSTRERATGGSGRLRGCRTPRPDTGSRSSPRPACRSSTRPRGRAT